MIPRPKRQTSYARWKARDKREFRPYIDWLSKQPCAACGRWPVEIAHGAPKAFGQKSSFRDAIALCPDHHRINRDSAHVMGRFFWEHWGLDRAELVAKYHTLYQAQQKAA
jgi:hypothetical protein